MSLFPAYSASASTANTENHSTKDWLSIKSFDEKLLKRETSASVTATKETATESKSKSSRSTTPKTKRDTGERRSDTKRVRDELEDIESAQIDRKGDRNNLCFDSLYFKNVANYDRKRTIDITKKRLNRSKSKSKSLRYFSSKSQTKINDENTFYFRCDKDAHDFRGNNNFIALSKQTIEANTDVEPNIKFSSMTTEKNYGPQPSPTFEQMIHEKTETFNRYLNENVYDIKKWLSFIAFQDQTIVNQSRQSSIETATAEKKLSICERALLSNPNCVELLLCRLEILSQLWEFDKLSAEWKRLTFLYPNSIEVWKHYLRFTQSNISHFSATKTISIYRKCLSVLNQIFEKTFNSRAPPPKHLDLEIINMFSSYCEFLSNIGHTERAVATFQALIEFNLFTPSLLTFEMPVQKWITLFEPFWDSNAQRFGEDGAIGWDGVMKKKSVDNLQDNVENSLLDSEENNIISENVGKNIIWLKIELLRYSYHWLPSKSEDVDDPERMVLSDDVTNWLFRLKSPKSKYYLIIRFLAFLGVNVEESFTASYRYTGEKKISIKNFGIDLPLMPQLFNQQKFINNIFEMSMNLFDDQIKLDLIIMWIKMKVSESSAANLKQIRKFIKGLLSDEKYRNCLLIWGEFAHFEWTVANNVDEGRKIFQTAINMMIQTSDNADMIQFVRKYVSLELGISSLEEMSCDIWRPFKTDSTGDQLALNAILSVFCCQSVTKSTPSLILKALNSTKLSTTSDQLFCVVYLHYLTKGLSHSVDTLEQQLSHDNEVSDEQTFAIYLQLLLLHVRRNAGASLSSLRSSLSRALYLYPNNNNFLALFVNLETNSNIFCRMSRFFAKNVNLLSGETSADKCWHFILYAIHSEMKRLHRKDDVYIGYDTTSGVINRVRAIFERSLSSPHLSNSITLWRLYCKFETQFKVGSHSQSVFYRALQRCPSSKILYLDGIQYFPTKLQELVDVMVEKEMRVRTPIEEIDLLMDSKS